MQVTGTALSILAYMTCSSLALVSNKVTVTYFPAPACVFVLQILVTVVAIQVGACANWLEVDRITWPNVKVFIPYICSFVISLYSNGRALANSNVETVIVFRACSPLFVCVLDYLFLGREFPSIRSLFSLVGVVCGAMGYVVSDSEFALKGITAYFWVLMNLAGIVFEMTYGKRLISHVTFDSPVWGATLYTNLLAVVPMAALAATTNESTKLDKALHKLGAHLSVGLAWLAVSCVIGVGISWSGWNCRSKISATAYTLVGVVCKFVSVVLNMLLWDKHATPMGLLMLTVCLISSALYEQAPMRNAGKATAPLPEKENGAPQAPKASEEDDPEAAEVIGMLNDQSSDDEELPK
mmetsp:Transcript_21584/g.46946  ORF Transcript_21584/g.46946 Transcript_21584/m.46946 type:complete len:353 (+) Transcript_21584:635-1693(+)